jgi:biotin carboxylase
MKKKLAIIGANYLQTPLVQKAVSMGIETHVFAWEQGAVAATHSDYFYPISVLDRETILRICKEVGIHGITSVGSDTTMPTVNYIAQRLGLVGNSLKSTLLSTNKFEMRKKLSSGGIRCPKFKFFKEENYIHDGALSFPLIVKPVDRGGSIGVTKVKNELEVQTALSNALQKSFSEGAIVEEFINGREFSVEMISKNGSHHFIIVTEKVTTGPPHFVEIAHHQPAQITPAEENNIIKVVKESVNALGIKNGATHSEVILSGNGDVWVVEVAGRMGGDFIGSHMVKLSTGFDYLKAVIDISLGQFDENIAPIKAKRYAGVYYVIPPPGEIGVINDNSANYDEIKYVEILKNPGDIISGEPDGPENRSAIMVYASDKKVQILPEDVITFSMSEITCLV